VSSLTRNRCPLSAGITVQFAPEYAQFDALVSLAFNIGADAFGKSSLAKAINNNDTSKIESRMKAWNKGTVDGKLVVLDGLVARRNDEYEMFSKGDYARDYDYNR
jgi:GH24 family phage-related lysozyme (muramidase)